MVVMVLVVLVWIVLDRIVLVDMVWFGIDVVDGVGTESISVATIGRIVLVWDVLV